MIDQLRHIAADIDNLIRTDAFPDSIRPDYLREAVRDYPVRGGKRIRPALLIWSCELFGGDPAKALYPAAAAEVFHNWTLVHDDIIDQDSSRRGKPTSHVSLAEITAAQFQLDTATAERTGRDFAILTGDMQQAWANDLLLRSVDHGVSPDVAVALARRLQLLAGKELISGEALDVEFSMCPVDSLSIPQVREMIYLKTGALLRFCTEAGAMIALSTTDPETPEVKMIGQFASAAGVAFQLRDDHLGIFGNYSSFGKALGADLRETKATLLLITALRFAGEEQRQTLLSLLGRPEYSQADLELVRDIMNSSGATAAVEAETAQLAEQARNLLRNLPATEARQHMLDLVNYLINRER